MEFNGQTIFVLLELLLFVLQTNYVAATSPRQSTWKNMLSVANRGFDSPNVTSSCADVQKCVLTCHKTAFAESLTFHSGTNACNCYDVDKSNGTTFTAQPGTLFYAKRALSAGGTSGATSLTPIGSVSLLTKTPCKELLDSGQSQDGLYQVTAGTVTFTVVCNMTGGGWTMLQRRVNGTEPFDRTYQEYVDGFGSLVGEFWLGLEYIYLMNSQPREVKFDLLLDTGTWLLLQYSSFQIENAAAFYKIQVSGHVASAGMCTYTLTYNTEAEFYAKDRDRAGCAYSRRGGWWFVACTWLNINGGYGLRDTMSTMGEYCNGYNHFTATSMSIR